MNAKRYLRVMPGRQSVHAAECLEGGFIGTDFGIHQDLSGNLPDEWRAFNKQFIPAYLKLNPERSKISAGLACGAVWTVSKGIKQGDVILCPDGTGVYRVGEITSDYYFEANGPLQHRRRVNWLDVRIPKSELSQPLKSSAGSAGTVSDISGHRAELERLIGSMPKSAIVSADPTIEDPIAFAMEKHLEEFLAINWKQTELTKEFSIYEEDGEQVGQQYATDAGPIDILAISKDRKRLLVVELKRGRASDVVVGQILRYMGYIKEEIAEPNQTVEGIIIALDDDQKLRWALAAVPSIKFYRYEISFKLVKG